MASDSEDPAKETEEVVDEKAAMKKDEKEVMKDDGDDDKKDIGAGDDTNGVSAVDEEQPLDTGKIVSANKVNEEELEEKARKNLESELVKATEVKRDSDVETPESKKLDFLKKVFILLFLLGGVAFASIAGVLLPDARDRDPAGPLPETEQLKQLFAPINGVEVFDDPNSPQSQALKFLVEEDELDIDFYDEANEAELIERYVMMVVYYSTDGPNWTDQLLFGSEYTTCEWPNIGQNESNVEDRNEIDCDADGRIIKVRLEENNLNGTIPMEVSALSKVEILTFGGNAGIVGTIPPELTRLSDTLNFWQTSGCRLTGTIPTDITLLSKMAVFAIYRNEHTGPLPDLSQFPQLRSLDMAENQFTGTLPELAPDAPLKQAYMEGNQLVGTIPLSWYKPTAEIFSFNSNALTGSIPTEVGLLEAVQALFLNDNMMTGSLPTEIGNLPNTFIASFNDNAFTGTIPTEFGNLRSLFRFDISRTDLTGGLPTELGQLDQLNRFRMAGTALTGAVPIEFSNLEGLAEFEVQNTTISGGLEEAFCSQDSLTTSITADCLASDPNPIACSCCTSCCANGEDCETQVIGICENQAGRFEKDLDRNATCTCLDEGLRLECTDQDCESCNLDGDLCAINTQYGYEFNETSGEILSFHNTIEYVSGFVGTTIEYVDKEGEGCDLFLNGEKCRTCGGTTCQSGFVGFSVNCDNVEGGSNWNSCEEFVNPGFLEILFAFDPSQLTGCPLLLERL